MSCDIILGGQWGDEGKARVVDLLADKYDCIVRFQGGANAGHTVVIEDEKYVFHQVPSGIIYPDKIGVIGNGCVLDMESLREEINTIQKKGISLDNRFFISSRCTLLFPLHKLIDSAEEDLVSKRNQKDVIGTTRKGIAYAYGDKTARIALKVADLYTESFESKLKNWYDIKAQLLEYRYGVTPPSFESVKIQIEELAEFIKPWVADTVNLLHEVLGQGGKILLEGAQGTGLDLDFGTYPFVTSSHTTSGSACIGTGIPPTAIRQVIGIFKPYVTRVGMGPFPTEINGEIADNLCKWGNEFGSTTGRRRRVGWMDFIQMRYSIQICGITSIVLTKLDVLDQCPVIKVGVNYSIHGEELNKFPESTDILEKINPTFEEMPGWLEGIQECRHFEDLPENAQKLVKRIEKEADCPIELITVGPERSMVVENPQVNIFDDL